jgi:hypothetical protein
MRTAVAATLMHSFLRVIIIIATRFIILKMIKYSIALVMALVAGLADAKRHMGLCP